MTEFKQCNQLKNNKNVVIKTNAQDSYPYDINSNGYSISTIYNAYGIKPSTNKDIKVGIIQLGGGYLISDIESAMSANGFPEWKASEHVFPYFIDEFPTNVKQNFYNDLDSSTEVTSDIEIAAWAIPNGRINVYFSFNTWSGFINAVKTAINDNCTTISISWGSQEWKINTNLIFSFNKILEEGRCKGISIFCATGDLGDITTVTKDLQNNILGYQLNFPASSPNVIACGGTNLSLELYNGKYCKYSKETSWIENDDTVIRCGTGGLSMYFNKPKYQKKVNFNCSNVNENSNKRGVPDISGNSSIYNSWIVYFNGKTLNHGGTSAVAPMWAGYTAGLNCNVFLNDYLYKLPKECFHDITEGINYPYSSSKGYDLCTGLGSPNGEVLTKYLLQIFKKKNK